MQLSSDLENGWVKGLSVGLKYFLACIFWQERLTSTVHCVNRQPQSLAPIQRVGITSQDVKVRPVTKSSLYPPPIVIHEKCKNASLEMKICRKKLNFKSRTFFFFFNRSAYNPESCHMAVYKSENAWRFSILLCHSGRAL